jgi:hypothetical protein
VTLAGSKISSSENIVVENLLYWLDTLKTSTAYSGKNGLRTAKNNALQLA